MITNQANEMVERVPVAAKAEGELNRLTTGRLIEWLIQTACQLSPSCFRLLGHQITLPLTAPSEDAGPTSPRIETWDAEECYSTCYRPDETTAPLVYALLLS